MHGNNFFIKIDGKTFATPLLAILILVEITDIIFAIDSIPAVFSITLDSFIVYSSNLFAIMGLRSMYFVLGNLQEKFEHLKYGVSIVLAFTGVKLISPLAGISISTELSLLIILVILVISMIVSVALAGKKKLQNA